MFIQKIKNLYFAVKNLTGGVTFAKCPYKCISDKYRMPNCYTPLQELIHTFGGPWIFGFFLIGLLVLLALVISLARVKFIGTDDFSGRAPIHHGAHIDHSLPFLESLNEVYFVLMFNPNKYVTGT